MHYLRDLYEAHQLPEFVSIRKDGTKWARAHTTPEVVVDAASMGLMFSIAKSGEAAKKTILDLKKRTGEYLQKQYPHRTFIHMQHRGYKVWNYRDSTGAATGLRCGLEIKPIEGDELFVLHGGLAILREAAVAVKQIQQADKETTVKKWDITGRKADQYSKATWDWLVKKIPSEQWSRHSMDVKVLVWDRDGKAAHDRYGQVFTPDKTSIKAAIKYAQQLIADDIANMTEVVGRFRSYSASERGMSAGAVMSFGMWERADRNESLREVTHSQIAGAIFDFAGYLTTRPQTLRVGAAADAAPIADYVKKFAATRSLQVQDARVRDWSVGLECNMEDPPKLDEAPSKEWARAQLDQAKRDLKKKPSDKKARREYASALAVAKQIGATQ